MSIPGSANPLLLASAAEAGVYQIERSIRLNAPDSAYLSRTPSVAGNRKTWTWAGWVKRSRLTSSPDAEYLFDATSNGVNEHYIRLNANTNYLEVGGDTATYYQVITSQTFRDVSAWYHVAVAMDTTQAVDSNRIKLYVNGVQVTSFSTQTWPTLNADGGVNSTGLHTISRRAPGGRFFSGYLADIHFIDGQALDPTSFGEFDTNGVWQPKAYTGSYGTNGFHLPFSDNSTTAALGTDTSGAGNNWTVNNISPGGIDYAATGSDPNSKIGSGTYQDFWDGSTSTYINVLQGGYVEMTNTQLPSATSTVGFYTANGASTATLRINGVSVFTATSATLQWYDFSYSGPITKVEIGYLGGSGSSNNFYAFRVDGVTIVGVPGKDNDSLVDTPTNYGTDTGAGGEVRGNYCTANPLDIVTGNGLVLANGNLDITLANAETRGTIATPTSGRWYYEWTINRLYTDGTDSLGITAGFVKPGNTAFCGLVPSVNNGYNIAGIYKNGSRIQTLTGVSVGDVFGIALDLDNLTMQVYRNGAAHGSLVAIDLDSYKPRFYGNGNNTGDANSASLNFGQRPFAYPAPSGYKALCTTNLPDPVVAKSSDYFQTVLYTGNGSTQTISGLGFSPDLVWIKRRDQLTGYSNAVQDTVRGATKGLITNRTDAEYTYNSGEDFTAFTSDGFSLATPYNIDANNTSATYVAWCWDAGSSTVTNTQGSITSQVRANPSAGFSIVTATLNGTVQTVGHGLNATPFLVILKRRDGTAGWPVYHRSVGSTQLIELNSTNAASTNSGVWNNTDPTSSVFTVGNAHLGNYVAYCFAPVAGYSSFGSYTGNGSADGTFVYTGFRPRWVMVKASSISGTDWIITDSARNPYNIADLLLKPHSSTSEATFGVWDQLSNGFKIRTNDQGVNQSGTTYVWAAFAEHPFQYARAR